MSQTFENMSDIDYRYRSLEPGSATRILYPLISTASKSREALTGTVIAGQPGNPVLDASHRPKSDDVKPSRPGRCSKQDRDGETVALNTGKVLGAAQQLTLSGGRPHLSSDGRRLVFVSYRSGDGDIWLRDVNTGKETALTATPWRESHPLISPDGSKVTFASREKPKPVMYLQSLRKGIAEILCDDCGLPLDWWSDGRRILYYWGNPVRFSSIDIVTRHKLDVIQHPKYNIHRARLSADGSWITFHMSLEAEEGRSPIYIAPLRNGVALGDREWIQVTDGTGFDAIPWWSENMDILYFLSKRDGFQCIWAQHLDKRTQRPVGGAFDVYHFHSARHKVFDQAFGPAISADKLIVGLSEATGNIWTAKAQELK
jgi:hypothetical protein